MRKYSERGRRGPLALRNRPRRPLFEPLEERTLLASALPITGISWTPVGPAPILNGGTGTNDNTAAVSGRIVAVAGDPSNSKVLYIAAAGGGVWKTVDSGSHWTPLTDSQSTLFMGAIAVAPSQPNTLYAGTGEASFSGDSYYGRGVLKSTDGGSTWTLLGNAQFDRHTISKIVVHPTDPNTVYVAVANGGANGLPGNAGIWKSTDGGATWTNTTVNISTTDPFTDLAIDPVNPNTLFAAAGSPIGNKANGVYKTTDGGKTWNLAGDIPAGTGDGRIELALAPSNPQVVYAAIADPQKFGLSKMMKTTNGGTTWTQLTNTPDFLGGANGEGQGNYDNAVAVDPTNANIVYAAGVVNYQAAADAIIESRDGGNTWTDLTVGANGTGPHTDHHGLGFDAAGRLLDGNDGGIWRLDNALPGSVQWTDLNTDLQITQFTGIALDPNDPNLAYGGSQDNGTEKFTGTIDWSQVQVGDGGFVRVAVDPLNPNTVYHTFYYPGSEFFERSDNGGTSWTTKTSGIDVRDPGNFYIPYLIDPSNPNRLVLGTNRVYETTNRADQWTAISAPNSNGWTTDAPIDALAIAPSSPNTIYATAGGHVFVTTNDGGSWQQRDIPGASDHFASLVVDASNSQVVYAVRDLFNDPSNKGHVFRSSDGGQNWTDISGNLPDLPTFALATETRNSVTTIFVGTDSGVDVSTDLGKTWTKYASGLPNAQVVDLELIPRLHILAAGTHGRGMWEVLDANTLPVQAQAVQATEGSVFTTSALATFTDPRGADPPANYTATISWSDGTTSAGTVTPRSGGGFQVSGSHVYPEEGTFGYAVVVSDSDGDIGSALGTALVDDAALNANVGTISLPEGTPLAETAIATFSDTDPNGTAIDYTATIDWGDGSQPTAGTIAAGNGNTFVVLGNHTYSGDEGRTFPLSVTISDSGGSTIRVSGTAAITDAPISVLGSAASLSGVEGATLDSVPVATITDSNVSGTVDDFQATIDWGDGTTATTGTVVAGAAPGQFLVNGSHTYTQAGRYTVTVTTNDVGGSTAAASSQAVIADAPLTSKGTTFGGIEGTPSGSMVVASFSDANPFATPADFSATINWADNSASPADSITAGPNNTFNVLGSHTYAHAGQYPVSVVITDRGGATITALGTGNIGEALLTVQGVSNLPATVGSPTGDVVVATFSDNNPSNTVGHYAATIDWGDGLTTAGTLAQGPNNTFVVLGNHSYVDAGAKALTVTIRKDTGLTTSVTSTALVADLSSSQPVLLSPYFGLSGETPIIANVTGLGRHDLIAFVQRPASSGYSPVFVSLRNPDGSYSAPILGTNFFAPAGELPLAADVNGDGKADLVSISQTPAASGSAPVRVALGNGDGTFGPSFVANPSFPAGATPVAGDINGDGRADLVTVSAPATASGFQPVMVALGQADGSFGTPTMADRFFAPAGAKLALGDVNGDGRADLVTFTQHPAGTSSPVYVAFGQADGSLSAPILGSPYFAPAGETPAVADINGDGFADLVTFTQQPVGGFSPVYVALGTGTGSFGAPIPASPYFAPAGETPAVADLNGDGRADFVTFTQRPAGSGFSPVFVAYAQTPAAASRRASLAATAAVPVPATSQAAPAAAAARSSLALGGTRASHSRRHSGQHLRRRGRLADPGALHDAALARIQTS